MQFRITKLLIVLLLPASLLIAFPSNANAADDPLIDILSTELNREIEGFKKADVPPYYIDYRVNETYRVSIHSSFSSLISSDSSRSRVLTTSVRVGNYKLDNTRELKQNTGYDNTENNVALPLPIENVPLAIQQILWLATDRAYKTSLNSYNQVVEDIKYEKSDEPEIDDFSTETPEVYIEPSKEFLIQSFNIDDWEQRIKKYTQPFIADPSISVGDAIASFIVERKYFVSSEGTRIAQNSSYMRLQIYASIKSEDGNILPLYKTYFAFTPSGLPSDEVVLKDVKEMIKLLQKLKVAPIADPFSGPAILSSAAAGVFFHEIFGHRIEGHRVKSAMDGNTFKDRVSEKVLSKDLSVYSDPTLQFYSGQDLSGFYKYDDQGVKAQKVEVVKNGTLINFLMSRTPIKGFPKSNGHGRAQGGYLPVTRQSNLIITTTNPLTEKDLRKALISECKKQNKAYGYFFKEVVGGFTITDRYTPNVFNIYPTVVYRIYVDGRPDELVRGVNLIGTPLAMFSQIAGAGDSSAIFTGICGAESGGVPVTTISPALFVKRIETQRKPETFSHLPILPMPNPNMDEMPAETGNKPSE